MYLSSPLRSIFDDLGITSASLATWGYRVIGLVIIWSIVWILVRYLSRWLELLARESEHLDVSSRDLKTVDRLLDYITVLVGVIVSLAVLGWTSLLYSALTAAGVFSIMIGFAVKDVAANFVSGIFILMDRPFAPGDYIAVGNYSGTVQNISLRSTTLITADGPMVHIPNSMLTAEPTINYSLAEHRRINFAVSIANETDVGLALKVIQQVLMSEERLLTDRAQSVLVNQVREYAVDLGVTCYAPSDTWLQLMSDLQQEVISTLQENHIELAVPMRKHVNLDPLTTQAINER
jgi:small conductance mechanosensitive channel